MNKEIKFRAWDKKTNKYHYFDLIDNTIRAEFTLDEWVKMPKEQYTGLKDKQGKEIQEGDIVKVQPKYDEGCEVIFEKGCFGLNGEKYECYSQECFNGVEIISNIYESPKLLKGEK